MTDSQVAALTTQVLWAAFFIGAAFGAIVQRTNFCTMGSVSDIVTMGDWTRMRQWVLAMGVAVIGFGVLAWSGQVDPLKVLYASSRFLWLSALAGGLLFGFGMVLASGCGSKTLVRVGSGNLKSLVVAMVIGIAGFATLKGVTAVLRTASVDKAALEIAPNAALPALLAQAAGWDARMAGLVLALTLGGALVAWALAGKEFMRGNNLLAGLGVGVTVVSMWWVSGHLGHVAEHPKTLEEAFLATNSGRAEALSFVAPVAYTLDWLMFFSDSNKLITTGIVSVFGVIAGSAVMALAQRSFRWEGFRDARDAGHHLIGGVLMGVGGVTALGCTIGQGISGLSTLSLTSFVALAAMIGGGVAGVRYQMWQLEREP